MKDSVVGNTKPIRVAGVGLGWWGSDSLLSTLLTVHPKIEDSGISGLH
ncbi:hypothetical protein ES703_38942 [subsurface metagenome]